MSVRAALPQTFTPGEQEPAQIIDFLDALRSRGFDVPHGRARLTSSSGQSIELPDELFDVLKFAAERLAERQGVTIIPVDQQLTTQQAADFLGMSRPSLVKIVEGGQLPCTKVGRHRRIKLADLVRFQRTQALEREQALREMAAVARAENLYERTAHPAEGIR